MIAFPQLLGDPAGKLVGGRAARQHRADQRHGDVAAGVDRIGVGQSLLTEHDDAQPVAGIKGVGPLGNRGRIGIRAGRIGVYCRRGRGKGTRCRRSRGIVPCGRNHRIEASCRRSRCGRGRRGGSRRIRRRSVRLDSRGRGHGVAIDHVVDAGRRRDGRSRHVGYGLPHAPRGDNRYAQEEDERAGHPHTRNPALIQHTSRPD